MGDFRSMHQKVTAAEFCRCLRSFNFIENNGLTVVYTVSGQGCTRTVRLGRTAPESEQPGETALL